MLDNVTAGASRRGVLTGGALAAVAAAMAPGVMAQTTVPGEKQPSRKDRSAGFYRFKFGDATVTVLSDGRVYSSDPKKTFSGGSVQEIDTVLTDNFLETNRVVLDENVIVIENGGRTVLIDCGVGSSQLFGKSGGKLLANMAAAGIPPADVGTILLSHAHPDHLGGLMTDAAARNFPNAQIYLGQEEFGFWTDAARMGTPLAAFHQLAVQQLMPNRDRLHFIKEGQEVVPGILAVSSPGHTIGHMHFLLTSAGKTLACTADLSRHHILGLEKRWEFVGDFDPKLSIATRERYLLRYAEDRIPILSYHYPWPGLGHVVRWGDAFKYIPTAMDMSSDEAI